MTKGYHVFVNFDGDIVANVAVLQDGTMLEPWRPFTYDTLPKAIAGHLAGAFYIGLPSETLPLFIHTGSK